MADVTSSQDVYFTQEIGSKRLENGQVNFETMWMYVLSDTVITRKEKEGKGRKTKENEGGNALVSLRTLPDGLSTTA